MNAITQNINAQAQETIDELRRRLDPLFQKTKGNLFYQRGSGFIGALLCKLGFQWTREIKTAAISATTLYWNPEFFLKLSKEMRITVLAHEIWHNAYMHTIRRGDRCPDIWNVAADHVINNMLEEHGYVFENWMDPSDPNYRAEPWCKDPKYRGWSTDEVYDDLIAGGMIPFQSYLALLGMFGKDIQEGKGSAKDINVANVVGAMATARLAGTPPGDIPGEVALVIDKFLNPKLPWETLLYNFMNALTSQEYSYARPNRRYQDPLLPGITGRNGLEHLVYMVDASGSMTDDQVLRCNSEIKYIQEELCPEKLSLIIFDTHIRSIREFEVDEPFEKIEIHGRGGTSLFDCWKYLESERPTAAVVFTDMGVSGFPANPGIPIIWICVDNPSATVPYGQLVHFSESRGAREGAATPDDFIWGNDPIPVGNG